MVVVAAAADIVLKTAFVDAAVVVVAGVSIFRIATFFFVCFVPGILAAPGILFF